LTRILIFYEYLIFARHAAVLLLFGKEEEALLTTLYTVKVIIHVKESDGEGNRKRDSTIHLTSHEGVGDEYGDENNLNDGHLGHDETLLESLNLFGGLGGILFHSLAVTWHFYYLPRK